MKTIISSIKERMRPILSEDQLSQLEQVLQEELSKTTEEKNDYNTNGNSTLLKLFLDSKSIEGCSKRTINYYETTIKNVLEYIKKDILSITTDDLRNYLSIYKTDSVSKVTVDNVRRILSSFFSWLENENHIQKSPVRRIHKIKVQKQVKETYTDESLEKLRDGCKTIRDLALIDFLSSTGIRVGELVNIKIHDIDFEKRECIVLGKGDKERVVYFDARTKIHLKNYLETRKDDNQYLFVSLNNPNKRLEISGVEIRLRNLGKELSINKVHPHKFRRTLATMAIEKGMPIEQVQTLLGHSKIDTTMCYVMVNQSNVKASHMKYIA